MNLFVYGTLMVPEIMVRAAGQPCTGKKAELHGYARFKLKEKRYPALVPATDQKTDGIIYFDLDEDAFKRLDAFEGEMYDRIRVCPRTDDHKVLEAFAYVLRQEYRNRLSPDFWSLEEFMKNDQQDFIRTYFGFDAV